MHSRMKIAGVTNGRSRAPSGGTAMPMRTTAAIARVPWRPSQASAAASARKTDIRGYSGDLRGAGPPILARIDRAWQTGPDPLARKSHHCPMEQAPFRPVAASPGRTPVRSTRPLVAGNRETEMTYKAKLAAGLVLAAAVMILPGAPA